MGLIDNVIAAVEDARLRYVREPVIRAVEAAEAWAYENYYGPRDRFFAAAASWLAGEWDSVHILLPQDALVDNYFLGTLRKGFGIWEQSRGEAADAFWEGRANSELVSFAVTDEAMAGYGNPLARIFAGSWAYHVHSATQTVHGIAGSFGGGSKKILHPANGFDRGDGAVMIIQGAASAAAVLVGTRAMLGGLGTGTGAPATFAAYPGNGGTIALAGASYGTGAIAVAAQGTIAAGNLLLASAVAGGGDGNADDPSIAGREATLTWQNGATSPGRPPVTIARRSAQIEDGRVRKFMLVERPDGSHELRIGRSDESMQHISMIEWNSEERIVAAGKLVRKGNDLEISGQSINFHSTAEATIIRNAETCEDLGIAGLARTTGLNEGRRILSEKLPDLVVKVVDKVE